MMKGWKTWFGFGVALASGIYAIIVEGEMSKGIALISGAISLIGIGHKIEKAARGDVG